MEKRIRRELDEYKLACGLLEKIPCTKEENMEYQKILRENGTLPEGVYSYLETGPDFYRVSKPDLTEEEIKEYVMYKQLSMIRTIKNCVLFFTILTIIGLCSIILINAL